MNEWFRLVNGVRRVSANDIIEYSTTILFYLDTQYTFIAMKQVLISLNKFAKKTKFFRVAAHAAKHILTQSEIRELSGTFKTFDQDGSGHISLEEFVDGMSKHVEVV